MKPLKLMIYWCLGVCILGSCQSSDEFVVEARTTIICNPTGNSSDPWEKIEIPEAELGSYLSKGALQAGNTLPAATTGNLINNDCQEVFLSPVAFNGSTFYVYPEDNSNDSGLPWAITYNITGATSLVDGISNSKTILLDQADQNDLYAAKLCDDLDAYGFNDWYLPSRGELNAMYQQLHLNDLGNFAPTIYWSSTEATFEDTEDHQFDSWTQVFSSGKQKLGFKNISVQCRCIRK